MIVMRQPCKGETIKNWYETDLVDLKSLYK